MARSPHMELEGLRLQRLEDSGLHVQTLVADRHRMVKKLMRTEHHDKKHYLDVWHMAKGIVFFNYISLLGFHSLSICLLFEFVIL